mmetsp:Transcript_1777/g.4868  ORF Transcript_1777/g.4868 Transcript_1777/m.4868 type:complete len:100 (+) Transcript_1777:3816-4115(+)
MYRCCASDISQFTRYLELTNSNLYHWALIVITVTMGSIPLLQKYMKNMSSQSRRINSQTNMDNYHGWELLTKYCLRDFLGVSLFYALPPLTTSSEMHSI